MKKMFFALLCMGCIFFADAQTMQRVLVFSKTAGYHHESIPDGIKAIQKLGAENHFAVDTTKDSTYFTDNNLKKYAAIIFVNTSGNVFTDAQKLAVQRFIEAGGGYMGIHCASSTEKQWPWYNRMVGAIFVEHPQPQQGVINVVDRNNPATSQLPARWPWKDEWYNFREIQPDLHVLLEADETSYTGGKNGPHHPLAWYHDYDGGRAFYTALGHFPAAYVDPLFVQHILAGIQYAIGKK